MAGGIIFVFLLLITIPFISANYASNEARVFGGFLINPIDGNSYLAKMRQGYAGSWLFTLPYTAEPGAPAAINLYYLFLGHLARWLGLSLIFTFHAARVVGVLALAVAVYAFFQAVLVQPWQRLLALAIALVGSGLGWLAASFGYFTSDFWVAEAYPFLASFANAHFPLGLALQVWLITPMAEGKVFGWKQIAATLAAAAMLSVIYPFGWLVAVAVSAGGIAWLAWRRQAWRVEFLRWSCLLVGGVMYVGYSLWVVNVHPILSRWNAQNVTPAPDLIDFVVSFSPALVLAIFAMFVVIRKERAKVGILAVWLLVGVAIFYSPVNVQRRLMSGLFIPIAGLVAFALWKLKSSRLRFALALAIFLFSLPTNLLIIAGGLQAAREKDPAIFVFRDERSAFDWLDEHAAPNSLVLASPETGLLIPAYSSARVVYGHPFETVDAGARLGTIYAFYSGGLQDDQADDLLTAVDADYFFFGPREKDLGPLPSLSQWRVVFEQGDVLIFGKMQDE